jgi:Ca-activated chloride channel homolog
MTLLAPLALAGLATLPVIVAFYMLRLRREERTVSSTFLWQHLVRDVEANAPWQRLRRSLLLLLQLLLAALLVAVVARPVWERPAGLARDLVLVIDASASMGSRDVSPDRLSAAKRAAIDALRDLPADGRVSVIAAGESARVIVNEARDAERAARAIESIEVSTGASDLTDALRLAGALAARARGAGVLVVTDAAGAATPQVSLDVPVTVIRVGDQGDNQAITALAARADPAGLERVLFVKVDNYSDAIATRRLQILADGVSVSARDLVLDSRSGTDVVIDELPHGTRVVEARLTVPTDGEAGTSTGPGDLLALDDAAWTVVPDDRLMRVLLVGPGNVYLQNALTLLPNIELYGATPEEWAGLTGKDRFDLFVFDGFLPAVLPDAPILAIAPPRTSELGEIGGSITDPVIGEPPSDEPLLRNVDLTRLHVARAQRMQTPSWARVVLPSTADAPLIYSGLRSGLPTTVIAFDLRQSDLPLQVAWPILLSTISGELLGVGDDALDPIAPASPIDLALRPGVTALRVTLPDGSVREVTPGATGASSVAFVDTRQLGIYRVEEIRSADGATAPSPAASLAPSAAAGDGEAPAAAGDGTTRFAVDLFSKSESNIAPGDASRLEALGNAASGAVVAEGVARDEWWPPLVALVLAILLAEWALYERDGARRIWAAVRGGLRRPAAASGKR